MNKTNIKDLSIQISLNGLSFCVLDCDSKQIEFIHHHDFGKKLNPFECLEQLKNQLKKHPDLSQNFTSVRVIYQNELSNLVPKVLFDEQQSADYLKFNSKILETDFISHDHIDANESVNVYVPYVNINNFIFDTFGEFEYKHASTVLIDTLLVKENKSFENVIYLNFNAHHFELVALRDKKLQLYNSFEYTTKEDVIYYVLFAMEQLHFNPETVKLKLIGTIEKNDDIYNIIYTYIRFVDFYEPSYDFDFNASSKPNNNHQSFLLLNSF